MSLMSEDDEQDGQVEAEPLERRRQAAEDPDAGIVGVYGKHLLPLVSVLQGLQVRLTEAYIVTFSEFVRLRRLSQAEVEVEVDWNLLADVDEEVRSKALREHPTFHSLSGAAQIRAKAAARAGFKKLREDFAKHVSSACKGGFENPDREMSDYHLESIVSVVAKMLAFCDDAHNKKIVRTAICEYQVAKTDQERTRSLSDAKVRIDRKAALKRDRLSASRRSRRVAGEKRPRPHDEYFDENGEPLEFCLGEFASRAGEESRSQAGSVAESPTLAAGKPVRFRASFIPGDNSTQGQWFKEKKSELIGVDREVTGVHTTDSFPSPQEFANLSWCDGEVGIGFFGVIVRSNSVSETDVLDFDHIKVDGQPYCFKILDKGAGRINDARNTGKQPNCHIWVDKDKLRRVTAAIEAGVPASSFDLVDIVVVKLNQESFEVGTELLIDYGNGYFLQRAKSTVIIPKTVASLRSTDARGHRVLSAAPAPGSKPLTRFSLAADNVFFPVRIVPAAVWGHVAEFLHEDAISLGLTCWRLKLALIPTQPVVYNIRMAKLLRERDTARIEGARDRRLASFYSTRCVSLVDVVNGLATQHNFMVPDVVNQIFNDDYVVNNLHNAELRNGVIYIQVSWFGWPQLSARTYLTADELFTSVPDKLRKFIPLHVNIHPELAQIWDPYR